MAAAAVVGNLLGGPALAVIFSAAAFVVLLPLKSRAQTAAETFLLNPALRLLLALRGDICLRYQAFLDYSVQAMLLKHVGAEYEFIHRLLRDHFAIRELIPALEGAKGEERLAVIDRLSRQGESSVEALTNLATHEDNGVRRAAVEGLGRTATPANLSVLTRTFKEDTSADVRGAVVRSLRRFSYGQASEILTLAIEDVAPEVRREVVASLQDSRFGFMSLQSGEFVTIIEKALSDKSEAVFRQGLTAIDKQHYKADKFSDFFRSNPTALTRLREAARSDAPEVRRAALRLMGYTQSPLCLPDLADALRDRDVGVRKAAVGGLSTLGLKEAVPLLLAALKDRKRSIRAQAVVALGGFGSAGLSTEMEEAVVAALRKAIGGWFMPSAAAADALGNFGGGKAIEVLKAAARHSSNDDVRQAAVKSLGKLCVKSAVPVLMHALRDKHCRADAARALGLIDDRSVIPTLLAWLDGGTRLRIPAVMTLAELKATEALSRLERLAGEPPRATLRVLRWFPGTALRDVRPYALVALGMLGDAGVLPTILGFATQAGERLAWAKTKALLCLRAEDTGEKFAELYDAASPAHQRQLAEIIANLHMVFRASGSVENDRAATSILNKVGERVSDKTGAVEQTRPRISRHKVYALFEHDASFFTV